MTVSVLCSCKRERQTVFTDTVYASENGGSSDRELRAGSQSSDTGKGSDFSADFAGSAGPDSAASGEEDADGLICVFVCGAVVSEGVYELPENARVIDAVKAAGGYTDEADKTYVNQAEYVYDTERIEIPTIPEAQQLRGSSTPAGREETPAGGGQEDGLININTADAEQLMKIPGIGESKAERIIEYRRLHGRFGSAEELMNVSGIGSGIYEKMKDYITVK